MSNISETDIVPVVLDIIRENPGIRTSQLIAEARKRMKPDGEDLRILEKRNDDRFSQKVRNIKSHNSIIDFTYTEGLRDRRWYLKQNYLDTHQN